jgi:hypothetical protein
VKQFTAAGKNLRAAAGRHRNEISQLGIAAKIRKLPFEMTIPAAAPCAWLANALI